MAIPLLESQFGFTHEMSGVLTAVYMFFDPFGTATNVSGNGVFAILFAKIFRAMKPVREEGTSEVGVTESKKEAVA